MYDNIIEAEKSERGTLTDSDVTRINIDLCMRFIMD